VSHLWVRALLGALLCTTTLGAQVIDSAPTRPAVARTIALDARLAIDEGLQLGDTVRISASPNDTLAERAVVSALLSRRADPSEIARQEYRARMHLDQLQRLIAYGDRVDRFAVRSTGDSARTSLLAVVNNAAFGFRAWPSADIAVRTSRTFEVVRRFNRAIGVITIVASAAFLLCILLLKIDERRDCLLRARLVNLVNVKADARIGICADRFGVDAPDRWSRRRPRTSDAQARHRLLEPSDVAGIRITKFSASYRGD